MAPVLNRGARLKGAPLLSCIGSLQSRDGCKAEAAKGAVAPPSVDLFIFFCHLREKVERGLLKIKWMKSEEFCILVVGWFVH